jgi:hypothetical protein
MLMLVSRLRVVLFVILVEYPAGNRYHYGRNEDKVGPADLPLINAFRVKCFADCTDDLMASATSPHKTA